MTHNELNMKNINYGLNKSVQFRVELNKLYNDFSWKNSRRQGKTAWIELQKIIILIYENEEYIKTLPKEEWYIISNCVRLARSEGFKDAITIAESQTFVDLEENYKNSR